MSRPVFPQLDTVRAIAALAVVGTHTAFWSGMYTRGTFGTATQRLEVGVPIFFVLSGFLLGLPYVQRAVDGTPTDPVRRYALKRVLRILPVYGVTVVGAALLVSQNRDLSWDRWVTNLLLVDYFTHVQLPEGLTQMWSLSVEAAFYAVLPLIGLMLAVVARPSRNPVRRLLVVVAAMCAFSIAWVAVTHALDPSRAEWATRWLPAYLSWFALGIGLAVTWVAAPGTSRVADLARLVARDRLACWTAAVALFVLVSTPLAGSPLLVEPTAPEATFQHVLYGLIALLVVLPCVHGGHDRVAEAMSHPLARHLGHLSYSLFCTHVIVLYLVYDWFGFQLFNESWPVVMVVVLGISLLVSEILFRLVETPALRLAHRHRDPVERGESGRRATDAAAL